MLVIFGSLRAGRTETVAFAVGGYITAAYWFTSSTSFANPAVTVARMFSDTFAGIAPGSVPLFLAMQLIGGALALALVMVLYPNAAQARSRLRGRPRGRQTRCQRPVMIPRRPDVRAGRRVLVRRAEPAVRSSCWRAICSMV